ncbi:hypothetical protein [Arundinibacter roseus]|uniref:Uncharacterized protein n=1 Tax=Arundinibacter roseus TaxID=2070510 RepID=A0A4R4K4H7_9BACT|nr:hypothetical protein [Arundinibacter roseus]TDB62278.1 hypothetical protein EZE20_17995 [Arundinibacter roseus]
MKTFNSPTEKQEYYAKRRNRGLRAAGLGAFVLGLGFTLQYILYVNGLSFNSIMYGMTLVGGGLIFYAAVEILG